MTLSKKISFVIIIIIFLFTGLSVVLDGVLFFFWPPEHNYYDHYGLTIMRIDALYRVQNSVYRWMNRY